MYAPHYVNVYPLDLSPEAIHAGEHSAYIPDAQDWSYKFGRRLFADLAEIEPDTFTDPEEHKAYRQWVKSGIYTLEESLMAASDTDDNALRALNEINFHLMNSHMDSMWTPIREHTWGAEGNRQHHILAAERSLAVEGFFHYALRESQITGNKDAHALFEGPLSEYNKTLTGMVQEIDTGLLLLGVARKYPNLTFVPAPLNFERFRKRTNVDFVGVDYVRRRAIGIQTKMHITEEDRAAADPKRVVFIDGAVDFENIRAMRTQRGRSAERVVSWPGIIAAKLVDGMKAQKRMHGTRLDLKLKNLAKEMVGDIKIDYDDMVTIIGERIMSKL